MFEVTTLGQPLEVLKTQMAANRSQTMAQAARTVWSRGGIAGLYQGLIPWRVSQGRVTVADGRAWIEASSKGAVLLFTASEVETVAMANGISKASAGLLGGMVGGLAQAYLTVGTFVTPSWPAPTSDHILRKIRVGTLPLNHTFGSC